MSEGKGLPVAKRALIFGVSGQDGALLARLLLAKGYEVFGASRDAETQTFANLQRLGIRDQIKSASVSLLDFRSVLQAIKRVRPERFVVQKSVLAARRIAGGSGEKLELGELAVVRDWGWAPEYVDAMWRVLQQPRAEDFVVASGNSCALQTLVAEIFSQCGLDWRQHVTQNARLARPTDLAESRANPARAEQILGWRAATGVPQVVSRMLKGELV
ncbi:MAG: GDP-mannose 4,6-dehydratase [Sulfuritalea sp.]|nr:GDP-mannose 4,6-dehydratase [Sulfuritalea sp.]